MRYYTLAWFYNARDMLLHIGHLQFDHKTPHRAPGPLFGGTEILSFSHDLYLHQEKRSEDLRSIDRFGHPQGYIREYIHEVVNGSASIEMDINFHTTELWRHLTHGEPLSKIIVRVYEIQESGQLEPFVEYLFKECHLFGHKTFTDEYQIRFTYCCSKMHFFDGNRFASHERCKPFEPTESESDYARGKENYAHDDYARKQKVVEEERLKIVPGPETRGAPVVHRFDVGAVSTMGGQTISPNGLDDVVFHIVEKTQTIDELIDSLYQDPSHVTRTHFRHINSHLKNGFVVPSQLVLLSSEDNIGFSKSELLMKPELEKIEAYRLRMDVDHSLFAENFVDYGNMAGMAGAGISFGTTYFQRHVAEVQKVLNELQKAYSMNFRTAGGYLQIEQYKKFRVKKFNELNSLLTMGMQNKIYGGIAGPKMRRQLRLKPDLIEHDWRIKKSRIIPTLSEFYENTAVFKKTITRVSYLAIPFGFYETHTNIVEACREGEAACTKAKYVEWSGFAGSLAGGYAGATMADFAVTAIVVGLGGSGLILVAVAAGAAIAGGYALGKYAENRMRDAGESAYNRKYSSTEFESIYEPIWTPTYLNQEVTEK